MVPVSLGLLDGFNYNDYDDEDLTNQLLRESWANSTANNREITPIDNEYASLNTQIYNPITPPQSSHNMSLPLESSKDINNFNIRGH
jgi:hypothetical protein